MKKQCLTLALWVSSLAIFAQKMAPTSYQYSVNLNEVTNDQLEVQLVPPVFGTNEVIFRIPKIVPGTYSIYDFGRFITDFQVTPKAGESCVAEQIDVNSWKITNAKNIKKISYKVHDSWDWSDRTNWVFEPAGTNIEKDQNFVLNNHGFFGYFEDLAMYPFEISITKPEGFYGSTGLNFTTVGNTDIYKVENYHQLVDAPIMYNKPDTTFIQVGNARVLVSVFNPGQKVTSAFIAQNIEEVLDAQRKYLGGVLPVDKYAFIIYIPAQFSSMGFGALEHNNSSFYYLPPMESSYLGKMIKDIAAHEFFHIVTPLTIHSEEIHYFNYNAPQMSKHLWLYEGVTEYSASHVQVKHGLISKEEYLETIVEKMNGASDYNDTVPFTVMSKYCLDRYKDQYTNVYQKGALIGLCLDLLIIHHTQQQKDLAGVLRELGKKYGKNQPFKDDELFDEIAAMTHPEIRNFFTTYVEGNTPLPLMDVLQLAGIQFSKAGTQEVPDFGFDVMGIAYDESKDLFYIPSSEYITELGTKIGIKTGDYILSLNGNILNRESAVAAFTALISDGQMGKQSFTLELGKVKSNGKKIKKKAVTGSYGKRTIQTQGTIEWLDELTPQQNAVRTKWLNP